MFLCYIDLILVNYEIWMSHTCFASCDRKCVVATSGIENVWRNNKKSVVRVYDIPWLFFSLARFSSFHFSLQLSEAVAFPPSRLATSPRHPQPVQQEPFDCGAFIAGTHIYNDDDWIKFQPSWIMSAVVILCPFIGQFVM